jgi:hypothetical protein
VCACLGNKCGLRKGLAQKRERESLMCREKKGDRGRERSPAMGGGHQKEGEGRV